MPVDTIWHDDEQTIVRHIFIRRWTLPELRESLDTFKALHIADDEALPTYYISDMREASMIPKGVLAHLDDFRDAIDVNGTLTLIVGGSYLIRILVQSLQQIGIGTSMIFMNTLDDAEAFIAAHKRHTHTPV